MLRIKLLQLTNFGPYYGEHTLHIPEDNGVSIIWGNNGFGKTSIMNAFRYVLWGKIYDRKRRTVSPSAFVNTNALGENGDMIVELHMIYDEDSYIVTRGLKRMSGDGSVISDYKNIFHIKKNGAILPPQEKDILLESILPDKISRFYLFDGELLGEYEDLLDDTDESGAKIKRSIEDILGLPMLEDARDNLSVVLGKMNTEVSKITAADERTAALSKNIAETQEELDHLNISKIELQKEQDSLKAQEANILDLMSKNSKYSSLLNEKKHIEEIIRNDKDKVAKQIEYFQNYIDESWRYIINVVIKNSIDEISPKVSALTNKINDINSAKFIVDYIENALKVDGDLCPICRQYISLEAKTKIIDHLKSLSYMDTSDDERRELQKLEVVNNFLNQSMVEDNSKLLLKYLDDIEECQAEIDINSNKLSHIKADLSSTSCDLPEEEIDNLPNKYKTVLNKLKANKDAIEENQKSIDTAEGAIDKLNKQIAKLATSDEAKQIILKREKAKKVFTLFENSIDLFRNALKESVQKDASDLFTKISHDKNYKGLVINDNYGLQIVGSDGCVVPNRSSGYEQVVAISLISALHKNAPIEGPIFMDSTFQRVDEIHKLNILNMLPEFGNQVIVLAYDSEIGEKHIVRERLGAHLLTEYELQHTSSSKTSIEAKID